MIKNFCNAKEILVISQEKKIHLDVLDIAQAVLSTKGKVVPVRRLLHLEPSPEI